jgi:hypothetical protein
MKIDNYHQILKNLYPEGKTDFQPAVGDKFGDILKETIGNKKPEVAGSRPTAIVTPLSGIRSAETFGLDRQVAIDRVENLIDLLDHYRQMLSDPSNSLKKIDPVIKEIDQQKENLAPVLDSLPDGEKLRDIVNQTLVTAALETTKFYRGDYIAS